ncbi:hypothetical protein OG369_09675 [Streptomyces sp. NBC_01221]|uniref:hypothetical protein n=1 Tax=Streptomyces sp. NBC_01221 TaxID=2903782 RepID=UPI00224DFF0B|nr:hypothetical protein [Streptomyces sp. NBC_01221]MCX4786439.1 hypothetical protein [Streptomyces sp. NBC_01221]
MKILRNALAGLTLVLAATVIPATTAAADPIPDPLVVTDDFGWGAPPGNTLAAMSDFGWG